jgi:oligopeptide/dipeptide ABC transporter ATP-binding protein
MTSVLRSSDSEPVEPVPGPLMATRGLTVGFPTRRGIALAANRVDLAIEAGKTLGIVGESGSGKSVTIRALVRMVPSPGEVLAGVVLWRGKDLLDSPDNEMREIRGREIGMIFQDPATSLNPVYPVGEQISEILRVKLGMTRKDARDHSVELLHDVGIPSAKIRARDYPHQLSGGMRQRVMIAMAAACGPKLLLADEPTTALDVTIQDQILALLAELQRTAGMAMILVSHDLGVIAETCDEVAVMYAGHVVERGLRDDVITAPRHPYTQALLAAELVYTLESRKTRLETIGGQPPDLADLPRGCPFQPRCPHARSACRDVSMQLDQEIPLHASACPFVDAGGGSGAN